MEQHNTVETVQRLSLENFDPGRIDSAVQQSALEHTQVSPGRFIGQLLHVQGTDISVDWGRYNLPVIAKGTFNPNAITIGFVFHDDGMALFNGEVVAPQSMLIFSEGHELDTYLPFNAQWMALQVNREHLHRMGLDLPSNYFSALRLSGRGARILQSSLTTALHQLDQVASGQRAAEPLWRSLQLAGIKDAAIAALLQTRPDAHSQRLSSRRSQRIVRKTADFVDSHLHEPFSMSELSAIHPCTYKTLSRAFHRIYGLTPKEYITKRRLARLRCLLLEPTEEATELTDLYLRCGLSHFGRASMAYKAIFGEPPSETLAATPRRRSERS